jgi:Mn2+/Fe2+ NRAMP family transporter
VRRVRRRGREPQLLAGISRYVTVPLAGIAVSTLVLRGSFHRIEHVLLLLSAVFVTYIASGLLAHPDWGEAAQGLVVPHLPLTRDAVLAAVATIGTTLAPWGLVFIQSYAADKHLRLKDLRFENVDVIVGALLTGIIGLFVVVACAATLHASGIEIDDANDAAKALEPLAGGSASTLFAFGFLGAALLAAALVLIPGAPLIQILFLSQALNAVLLLVMLPFMRRLAADPDVMGEQALGRAGMITTAVALALIAASVRALAALTIVGIP